MPLIPVEDLSAVYDEFNGDLLLRAKGDVNYQIIRIHFKRDKFFSPGLKFSLRGWDCEPIYLPVLKPYVHDQVFHFPNLYEVIPSREIIIVSSNHPGGVVVPVQNKIYLGIGPARPPKSLPLKPLAPSATSDPLPIIIPEPIVIDVPLGGEFTIPGKVPTDITGSLDIDFNPCRFSLLYAGIDQGSLKWTFKALKYGTSRIEVGEIPYRAKEGFGLPFLQTYYLINVQIPLGLGKALPGLIGAPRLLSSAGDDTKQASTDAPFIQRLKDTLELARKEHAEAEIIYVLARPDPITIPPVHDSVELSGIFVQFKLKEGSAFIETTPYGGWGPLTTTYHIPYPLDSKSFNVDGLLDITKAESILREQGITPSMGSVELKEKDYGEDVTIPELRQPFYKFKLDGLTPQVGARTGWFIKSKETVSPDEADQINEITKPSGANGDFQKPPAISVSA